MTTAFCIQHCANQRIVTVDLPGLVNQGAITFVAQQDL